MAWLYVVVDVFMFPQSCVWSDVLLFVHSLSFQSIRESVNSSRRLFGCTFDVTVHRRPCIFHAVIKICRSGLPWHLSVLIWGSGAVTLVNAALSLAADLKDERWHFPPFCKLMQLICLTRTKLGFQIPHDEEIKPLNAFPKAIFIARPWARVIDLSVRISNRLLTWIYKMLLHCCIDPVEMPFPQVCWSHAGRKDHLMLFIRVSFVVRSVTLVLDAFHM